MPLLLQQTLENALQHAQTLEEHGKTFEKMASALDLRLLTREQAETIRQLGQQIQQHGQLMAILVNLASLDEQRSLEMYASAYRQKCQAILLYVEAIKIMLQSTQPLL